MAKGGASDWMERGSSRADEVDTRTTGSPSAHVLKIKSYNSLDETRGGRILTIGSRFDWSDRMCLLMLINGTNPSPPSVIQRMRYN